MVLFLEIGIRRICGFTDGQIKSQNIEIFYRKRCTLAEIKILVAIHLINL